MRRKKLQPVHPLHNPAERLSVETPEYTWRAQCGEIVPGTQITISTADCEQCAALWKENAPWVQAERERQASLRLTDRLREAWPDLVGADEDRNAGMPMELFHVEVYAEQAGVSPEEYIIQVLRAERERRQEQDRIVSDRRRLDVSIDEARAAGMGVLEHTACFLSDMKPEHRLLTKPGAFRPEDISKHFMMELIHRFEEREHEAAGHGGSQAPAASPAAGIPREGESA